MTVSPFLRSLSVTSVGISLLVLGGCRESPGRPVNGNDVVRLVAQLEGGRCAFHTEPMEEQLDGTCKRHSWSTWGVRLAAGRPRCAMWAAECLAQMGDAARHSVDSLISALETGPNNYDTGDGVIPARDAIAHALGRIGDPRAVKPLLDALRHPRPVEAGPGAIGYASEEPVGQVAALEALGFLGPAAAGAVPEILDILSRPIETSRDERRFRAAADALAGIGDPRVIPALARQLDDPRRRRPAARGLGEFGPQAAAVGPLLVALVERSPDAEGNDAVRAAVGRILGREAARRLPPNYDLQLGILWRRVADATKNHGCIRRALHIDSAREQFATEVQKDVRLIIRVDRQTWIDHHQVTGQITPVRGDDGLEPARSFDSFGAFDVALESLLRSYCSSTSED